VFVSPENISDREEVGQHVFAGVPCASCGIF
jgi:hypothetical protein